MSANNTPDRSQDVADLVNLFTFSLGAGAQMRIKRDAIRWFRAAFEPSLQRMVAMPDWPKAWENEKLNVLEYVKTIGRLAANRAVEAALPHIDLGTLERATNEVVERTKLLSDPPMYGNACSLWSVRPRP